MATLSDFETLEEAQAYSYVIYNDMSTSELNAYLGAYGLISYVDSLTDEKGLALQKTLAANGNFCFDESDDIGMSNLNYIDELVAKNDEYTDLLTALKVDLIDYCKSDEVFPFESYTEADFVEYKGTDIEELVIEDFSTSKTELTIEISEDMPKQAYVRVYEDFGSGYILCTSFLKVQYSALTYTTNIPASTAESRDIKLVSPFTVGLSVV